MNLIDVEELKKFFFSKGSGTEEFIRDLMERHKLNYENNINEDDVMDFALDLLKGVCNVIDAYKKG